jgi:hypothetical protein
MNEEQPPTGRAAPDRRRREPELSYLPQSENAVLLQRKRGDRILAEMRPPFGLFSANIVLVASHLRERLKECVTCG